MELPRQVSWQAVLLVVLTGAAYAPIYGAGFLNYDDPWLIRDNPFFAPGTWRTPWLAFSDFSRSTRLALGAEYLPLRDLLVWLETRVFGMWAPGMHAVSVLLYVVALLLLRGALRRTFGARPAVELACLLFALHPVHAESVAWLAGQKDVLALVFVCGALYVHAGDSRRRSWLVPLLLGCACFAKAMSVAAVGLLAAQDLVQRRRPDTLMTAACVTVVALGLAVHGYVGRLVGMVAPPAGGSLGSALITMGPVWLRYLALSLGWAGNSIAHDVPVRTSWDAAAVAGYAVLAAWLALALWLLRREERRPLYAFAWFVIPLLPVSQLVPLQHLMADRYLWLSVLGPCLLLGWALEAARRPFALRLGTMLLASALFVRTYHRAVLFSDSTLLFTHATRHTEHDTDAPLQLGKALEEDGHPDAALLAYREVLVRAPHGRVPDATRAANAIARLLAKRGELAAAERVLVQALARDPGDPTTRDNLARLRERSTSGRRRRRRRDRRAPLRR